MPDKIIISDIHGAARHVMCRALQDHFPQAEIWPAKACQDIVGQLSAYNVKAVIMDWHTSRQTWQRASVADYIRKMYPELLLIIVDGQVAQFPQKCDVHLTPREQEVLSHLRHGASNQEIARQMSLQIITVKLHVRSLCRKANVKNRTQLALWANNVYYPSRMI